MSKGGSSTQETNIPAYLENAVKQNLNRADDVSQIGYTPYYGPDVAALSPMQQQSMRSTGNAASAFGLAPQGFDAMAGMPQAQTFAGGLQGYSSAPLYQESVDQLQANRPAQFQAMADMFIDPFTGAPAKNNYQASPAEVQQMFSNGGGGGGGFVGGGGSGSGNNAMDMAIASGNQEAIDAINSYGTPNSVDTSGSGNLIGSVMDLFGGGDSFNAPISDLTRPNDGGMDFGVSGNSGGYTPPSSSSNTQSLLDNLSFGGSDNSFFSSANTPTPRVKPLAATVAARNAAKKEDEIEAQEQITLKRILRESAASNKKAAKKKKKKIVSNSGRETDNWSPPKNNGYAGQKKKKIVSNSGREDR